MGTAARHLSRRAQAYNARVCAVSSEKGELEALKPLRRKAFKDCSFRFFPKPRAAELLSSRGGSPAALARLSGRH
jgi:hypothetical protein